MSVPTNLIPSFITQLPEYSGTDTGGYFPYAFNGRTYKVTFGQLAQAGAVPASREINTGNGLTGGGNLTQNRTISIANGGVGALQLDQTGVVAGTYGDFDKVAQFTVDANGRISSVSDVPIVLSGYVPITRSISAGTGLSGGGTLNADRTISVDFSSATPEPLGVPSAGIGTKAAREDHVHPAVDLSDTTETQGTLPLARGGTGNSLSPVPGSVVYSDGTNLELTNPGNPGDVLLSDGSGAPYWGAVPSTGTVTSVDATGGTGISVTGGPITTSGTFVITNTAPDQVVSITGAGTSVVTGTYPNFTVTSNDQFTGTVTSVDAVAGTGISVSGGPITTSGSLTITNTAPDQVVSLTGGGSVTVTGTYPNFTITGAASGTGTVTSVDLTAGTGISVSGGPITTSGSITVTNTAPDQVVSLTGAGTTSITGTYPNFTITSNDQYTGTVTSVDLTAGTGISVSGGPITGSGSITVTNSAPDQIVSLTGAGTTSITGTYPNFTITSNDQYVGTVTSVDVSGGTTGLTFSGGPITTNGTITMAGTLGVANGGTGTGTAFTAGSLVFAGASGVYSQDNANLFWNDSNNRLGIGTASPGASLNVVANTAVDAVRITQTGAGNALVVEDSTNPDATPFVVNAGGQTLTGYTTALTVAGASYLAQAFGSGAAYPASFGYTGDNAFGANIALFKNRATAWGSQAIVQTNDSLGSVEFSGSDGTNFLRGAQINAAVDGTPGTNDLPTRLTFSTTADGAAVLTERMRITNAGLVGIGTTNPGTALDVSSSTNTGAHSVRVVNSNAGAGVSARVLVNNGTNEGGIIYRGTGHADAGHLVLFNNSLTAPITFYTAGSERMRISNTGVVTLSVALGISSGGTNGTATPTAGAVAYGTGSAYAFTSAGTAGQVLVSNGTSAPSFGGIDGGTF